MRALLLVALCTAAAATGVALSGRLAALTQSVQESPAPFGSASRCLPAEEGQPSAGRWIDLVR